MLSLSTDIKNSILDSIVSKIDENPGNGTLVMYTGIRPDQNGVPNGQKLISFSLSNPSFTTSNNGAVLSYSITPLTDVLVDGTATWFRIYNGNNLTILDGDISDINGDGDIKISSVDFTIGSKVTISKISISI